MTSASASTSVSQARHDRVVPILSPNGPPRLRNSQSKFRDCGPDPGSEECSLASPLAATGCTGSMSHGKTSTIRDRGIASTQASHEVRRPRGGILQFIHSGPFLHHWQRSLLRLVVVCAIRPHEAHVM